MKKILLLIATIITLISMCSAVYAMDEDTILISPLITSDDSIKVMQDGNYIDFTDAEGNIVEPQIINNRTMVPFRKIFNSLGVSDDNITWIGETRTVIAKKDNIEIELQIDNNQAKKKVDDEITTITLDSAPIIMDNRTMVPVRFIAESMQKLVGWDNQNRTVIIIDVDKIQNELREAIPEIFELIDSQTVVIETFENNTKISGTLKYTDEKNSSNNSTIKFEGNVNSQKSNEAFLIDLTMDFSGKGIIYQFLADNDLKSLKIKIILNKDGIYINDYSTKNAAKVWYELKDESITELYTIITETYQNPSNVNFFDIREEDLNIYTYDMIETTISLLKNLFGNGAITISGTKAKNYNMDLNIFRLFELIPIDVSDVLKECEIAGSGSIKNGVVSSSNAKVNMKITVDSEKIEMSINANSELKSYNKFIEIDIPKQTTSIEYLY